MKELKRGVKTEDKFQRTMKNVLKYIVLHRETSILIGIGIIGALVGMGYFLSTGEVIKPEAELMQTQAISFISMGRFQEAENLFTELSEKHSNTRPGKVALYYLGVINYHTQRFPEALDYFDKFLRKEGKDYILTPSARFGAGYAAEGLKDYERALRYYEEIVKDRNSPFYFLGMLALGRIKGILGRYEEAIQTLQKLLKANPPYEIASEAKFYLGYFNR